MKSPSPISKIQNLSGGFVGQKERGLDLQVLTAPYARHFAELFEWGPKKGPPALCHSCQQKETKFHAEAKFHSLVKGGELQAAALESTPSPWAGGGAAF